MIHRQVYRLKAGNINRLKITTEHLPAFIPGLEYAGQVINKGNEVTNYEIGDRIIGVTRFGAYTTHLNIHQSYIIPLLGQ